MKIIEPIAVTEDRRKILMFKLIVSTIVLQSDDKRLVMLPVFVWSKKAVSGKNKYSFCPYIYGVKS